MKSLLLVLSLMSILCNTYSQSWYKDVTVTMKT